jgi:hypothetical protein
MFGIPVEVTEYFIDHVKLSVPYGRSKKVHEDMLFTLEIKFLF